MDGWMDIFCLCFVYFVGVGVCGWCEWAGNVFKGGVSSTEPIRWGTSLLHRNWLKTPHIKTLVRVLNHRKRELLEVAIQQVLSFFFVRNTLSAPLDSSHLHLVEGQRDCLETLVNRECCKPKPNSAVVYSTNAPH